MQHGKEPVTALYGVGQAKAKNLAKLGITTVADLCAHYPRAYQNRGNVRTVAEAMMDIDNREAAPCSLILTVAAEPSVKSIRRGLDIMKFRAFDESGACEVVFFNQNYLKDKFVTGAAFRFWGKLTRDRSGIKLNCPVWDEYVEGIPLPDIVPVYPLTNGINQKAMTALVRQALKYCGAPDEILPPSLIAEMELCTEAYAMQNIHFPESFDALEKSRRRLMFDELFVMSAAMASVNERNNEANRAVIKDTDISPLLALLPYKLTGAQKRSIGEITTDMASDTAMSRILTGDVGSGKTIVAAAAVYLAAKNGYQSVIMAPTEVLATQHYNDIAPLFEKLGINTALLTGSTSAPIKRKIYERVAGDVIDFAKIDVVIGTHAVLNDEMNFKNLGLIVTDEQHKFGVMQRAALKEKSVGVNSLVMSATPIPRTLSLVYFGNLSVSKLDEMPPGRQVVSTYVVTEDYQPRLNEFIRKQARDGHQTYVVCPAIEESSERMSAEALEVAPPEKSAEEMSDVTFAFEAEEEEKPPLKAAVDFTRELAINLPELTVEYMHGRLRQRDKEKIMKRFADGEIQVLVSTTVIEVGVNVPTATLMIVENAERFGLSQLHQLRGRVGRGDARSYCVLVSDSESQTAKDRLAVMKKLHDGYLIAEEDLKLRGPGDILSFGGDIKQHGSVMGALARVCHDEELIGSAVRAAKMMLRDDPGLAKPENSMVADRVRRISEINRSTLS